MTAHAVGARPSRCSATRRDRRSSCCSSRCTAAISFVGSTWRSPDTPRPGRRPIPGQRRGARTRPHPALRAHGHVFHLCARPLYAAIGEEHNRNRRAAEWDAVIEAHDRGLRAGPSHGAVLGHGGRQSGAPAGAIFRVEMADRTYAPKQTGGRTTARYFVDKMPWYRDGTIRLWLAYVDAERTLHGFAHVHRPLISFTARRNSRATPLPFDAHLEIRPGKCPAARVDIPQGPTSAPATPHLLDSSRHSARHSAGSRRAFPSRMVQLTVRLASAFGGRVYPPSLEVVRKAIRLSVGSCCGGCSRVRHAGVGHSRHPMSGTCSWRLT